MNWAGTDHSYLTQGEVTVTSPRLSPDGERIAYMSFAGGAPHVRVIDIDGNNDRALLQSPSMSFSPRWSPDGRQIAFSMAADGNTDIYVTDAGGGFPRRLTTAPGVDTSPSWSPDGSKIVFESDRSGSQQLYVMDAGGSGQRRISFGTGPLLACLEHGWRTHSLLALDRRCAHIGVMTRPEAARRYLPTVQDEAPSWAPDSEWLSSAHAAGHGRCQPVHRFRGRRRAKRLERRNRAPTRTGGSCTMILRAII